MSWDNDHIPTVRITGKDGYSNNMSSMASTLKSLGEDDIAKSILQDKRRLDNNIPKAIKKIANDEVDGAMKLVRERQYHSKSGYVGHGNLMHSIKPNFKSGGWSADIAPHAIAKDGYEYDQAFEFGLKNKNYPAQHPMRDSGRDLDVDRHSDEAINNSIK